MPEPTVLCTAVVVRDDPGRVLLLRRAPGAGPRAGLWHLPGGRNEPGESDTACAHRELREETGIAALGMDYLGTTCHGGLVGVVFRAQFLSGTPVNAEPEVHDAIGWFHPDEPPEPLMTGTAEVLAWLRHGKVVGR
jgi:8-oxo-dGTP pyrophosphatase MutT (NUDIX family)